MVFLRICLPIKELQSLFIMKFKTLDLGKKAKETTTV